MRIKPPAVSYAMRNDLPSASTGYGHAMADIYCGLVMWESRYKEIFGTICGRYLYFKIAEEHFTQITKARSLKHAYYTSQISERNMRNTIRRFEALGYLEKNPAPNDLRASRLIPKEALLKVFQSHSNELNRLMSKHFFLVQKNQ
jgi:hypothetical protein